MRSRLWIETGQKQIKSAQRSNHAQRNVKKRRRLGFRSALVSGTKGNCKNAHECARLEKSNNWFKSFAALSGTGRASPLTKR